MALKPVLKNKVDELFLRWISEHDTQSMLKANLRQLQQGEPLSLAATYPLTSVSSKANSKSQSPRIRPGSPPLSSNKLPSPRSPRRPLASKGNHRDRGHNGNAKTISNGAPPSKEKEVLSAVHDLPESEVWKTKEQEDTTPNLNIQLSNHVTLDSNSNAVKENKTLKKSRENGMKQSRTVVIQNSANIPKFHYPQGKPIGTDVEAVLQRVSEEFNKIEGGKVTRHQMGDIMKACNLPLYWKCPVFMASGGGKQGYITYQMFQTMWRKLVATSHDRASQFVDLVAKPGTNYIEAEDLISLLQDVVDTHPGLTFLLEAPEFHSRYVNTVIARIMYCVNRSWSGRVTVQELRRSNFLQILQHLEEEDDINQVPEYFSYEHFYVIYCKFWELDKDHDLFIDRADLSRHNAHAISSKMIDRIFSGAVTRGSTFKEGKMSYPEFVWFLLSEEDKRHPTSVEYWFRCMDLDGDGVISMYEMEYFYEEQMQKMEALGIERLPFEDCLCQMIDLVRPVDPERITLSDLKRCRMTNIFYDTFFNLDKFLEHEQRDPFSNMRDLESDVPEPTDWEKYAAEEYEYLVAEEGANDQEEIHYEDDFEADEEEKVEEARPGDPVLSPRSHNVTSLRTVDDDIYDFSHTKGTKY